jgi:radical SAM-linked protein
MQRIVLRYRQESLTNVWNHGDLRALFLQAAEAAGLSVGEGQRVIRLGPPLPAEASSEAEYAVLELARPQDPSEVRRLLNLHLPDGLQVIQAWIAPPGSVDENPATLDEAVYEVRWLHAAPATAALDEAMKDFLAATVINFTRAREKKTQQLDARALVHDMALFAGADGFVRLRMSVSAGPRGTLRPAEALKVLGFPPAPGDIHVHRVALQRTIWRHPSPARPAPRWRRA